MPLIWCVVVQQPAALDRRSTIDLLCPFFLLLVLLLESIAGIELCGESYSVNWRGKPGQESKGTLGFVLFSFFCKVSSIAAPQDQELSADASQKRAPLLPLSKNPALLNQGRWSKLLTEYMMHVHYAETGGPATGNYELCSVVFVPFHMSASAEGLQTFFC